jgi:SSS family solute:Na+ symporter
MTISFFATVLLMVVISLAKPKSKNDTHTIEVDTAMFKVSTGFVIGSFIICSMLAALYTIFW